MQEFMIGLRSLSATRIGGVWRRLPNVPVSITAHGAAYVDGFYYIYGGVQNGVVSSNIWRLNIDTLEWGAVTVAANYYPLSYFSMLGLGDSFYVYGGLLTGWPHNNNELVRYVPALNKWEAVSTHNRGYDYYGTTMGTKLVFYGGIESSTAQRGAKSFDTVSKTWAALPSSGLTGARGAMVNDGSGIFVYGANIGGMSTGIIQEFSNSSWKTLETHLPARSRNVGMMLNKVFYTYGGEAGSPFEAFDTVTKTWFDLTETTSAPEPVVTAAQSLTPIGWIITGGNSGISDAWLYVPDDY